MFAAIASGFRIMLVFIYNATSAILLQTLRVVIISAAKIPPRVCQIAAEDRGFCRGCKKIPAAMEVGQGCKL